MPPIPDEFEITQGFPGTYRNLGGVSWYKDGDTNADVPHFTVNSDLSAWHLTYMVGGFNVGIWYHGDRFSNVNSRNLPPSRYLQWKRWDDAHWQECDAAAADFYDQFG
ncbi:MAG: hypothetical protein M0Z30_17160 [Actinomycetota bacterium]|nr:hypothetical protein [Actinomycetota bacterium]